MGLSHPTLELGAKACEVELENKRETRSLGRGEGARGEKRTKDPLPDSFP